MGAVRRSDRGQAFPIYIVMVAGLLFVAFAFFTVGKASAVRNGAQGAADAAALAAAQEARDEMGTGFLEALLLPGGLDDFFKGDKFFGRGPCAAARELAGENRSTVTACDPRLGFLRDEITVKVRTDYTVGKSVIPGTERKHATAESTAVVEFRCSLPEKEPDVGASPDDGASPGEGEDPGDEAADKPKPIEFSCDGGSDVIIDPSEPGLWDTLSRTLFAVHLVDVN
ncbi:pilus assembly protein TadG-related protein [Streptomyces sp. NPDC059134]|uniref:pilus assembly protein TadG-related protein n=1 Tax=Streptomyces sp. NPDC059134 TaxID=3346738 RepID=UPI0036958E69